MNRCLRTLVLLALATGVASLNLLLVPAARAQAPTVTTLPASGVTATNATLSGTVNPNGLVTTAYFQYGLDTNYGDIGDFTVLPATNATLTMPSFVVTAITGAAGSLWTQSSAPIASWYSIASSADGTHLAAVIFSGGIYTSTNSGLTWTQSSAPSTNLWSSITSSADGMRLAAGIRGGGIYTSTNSGVTWTQSSAPSNYWLSIASSADGTRLAAVEQYIWTSTDGGLTWTRSSAPLNDWWQSIASSADGTRLAAASGISDANGHSAGAIFTSTNGGLTWTWNAPGTDWQSIASSADGMNLAAVGGIEINGDVGPYLAVGIYTSSNFGLTWTQSSAPSTSWQSIASSADGTQLAAVVYGGGIYASTNSGVTWIQSSAPSTSWQSIVPSADGTQLAAVVNGGGIYTSTGGLSGLLPGTMYHYRLVGLNSAGTALGADMTFTTPVGAPTATTLPASGVTATNATLNATVNTGGLDTAEFFEYGMDTNYGSYTTLNSLAATNTTLSLSTLASLAPGTTYHFQIVGFNSKGIGLGGDSTFTTPPLPSAVTTLPASSITASNATLNGTVNPGNGATTAYFQYGLGTNYGNLNYGNVGPFTALPAGTSTLNLSNSVADIISGAAGSQWTQSSAPISGWQAIASSADGTRLAVVILGGGIYTSTDGGVAWTQSSAPGTNYWQSVATSADGTRLAAVDGNPGYIWTSTDGGVTWTQSSAPSAYWQAIASSADGTRLAAVVAFGGGIYTSTNSGLSWTQSSAPSTYWSSIASSADGTHLAAVDCSPGYIWTSSDGGATWTQSSAPSTSWSSIASSSDGSRLVAVDGFYNTANNPGYIWTSTNRALTWTQSSAPSAYWNSIASSADGMRLAAVVDYGGIYTSTDGGLTWTQSGAPSEGWYSIASSADGSRLAAVVYFGGIYTSTGALSGLTPNTTYHYRLVGRNSAGTTLGADMSFTTAPPAANPFTLSGSEPLGVGGKGSFQLRFTNISGLSFTVLTSTNLQLPLSNWSVLGTPVETPPGQYQFTDPQSTNHPQSFYRVRSP